MNESEFDTSPQGRAKPKLLIRLALAVGVLLILGGAVAAGAIFHFPPAIFGYSDEEVRSSYAEYCEHRSNYKRLLSEKKLDEAKSKERDAAFYAAERLQKQYGDEWAKRGLELKP
jgi:hypothetical protein